MWCHMPAIMQIMQTGASLDFMQAAALVSQDPQTHWAPGYSSHGTCMDRSANVKRRQIKQGLRALGPPSQSGSGSGM